MMNNINYVSLHNHCEYSNLKLTDSNIPVTKLIDRAIELGHKGISITDHNILSSHIKAILYVDKLEKSGKLPKGFTLGLGNEIYLVDEEEMAHKLENKESIKFYHFLLIALDSKGHEQIRELSTRSWLRSFSYRGIERTPNFYSDFEEVVGDDKGHLVACTACLGGFLDQHILKLHEEESEEMYNKVWDFLDWGIDIFGRDNFYLELQPSIVKYDKEGNEVFNEQKYCNQKILKISELYGIKYVITTDTHYLNKEDRGIHEAFLLSDEDGNSQRELGSFYETTYLHSIEQIQEEMPYLTDEEIEIGLENTYKVISKVKGYELFHNTKMPLTVLPTRDCWFEFDRNIIEEYPNIKKMYADNSIQHTYLIHQLFKGMKQHNIPQNDKMTLDRIEKEIEVLNTISEKMNVEMGAYLVTMQKYIDLLWDNNIVVGTGRGSAVGFICNYLLGITQVNPLTQGIELPYWRFLNKERAEYPDIDFDVASYQKEHEFSVLKDYMESIGGGLYRICTYSTLGAKSAIKTACKGIGINNDDSAFISSLLPIVRGKVRSISDTYYGNEKEGLEPVTEFVNVMDKYSEQGLLDIALSLEGLVVGMGSHASGVIPVNETITKTNSLMKTAGGDIVTAFDLHESELLSNIKYDFLIVAGIGLVQYTLEELVKQGKIEWKGTLRETYNSVLHPDVIDKEDKEIWDNICQGKIMSCFQFETPVGSTCIKKLQPQSLPELASANSLMRLRGDGEQPLDKYCRYKADEKEIELDMDKYNLTKEERKICYDLLSSEGMCMNSQELLMISVMKIANFTLAEANAMRKAVSKKKEEQIKQCKELFYSKGKEFGKSINLLDYIWKEQISMQLGYGFSVLHCVAYSWIAIQEAYLYTKYPHVYWNNAILLLESGSLGEGNGKEKATNYGKIASAIDRLQKNNVEIKLPNINISQLGFLPDENINAIHYGLKGINKINNETANIIIENRPYKSLEDFHKRLVETKREVICETGKKQMKSYVSTTQTIQLIKAGAFDVLESRDRFDLLHDYLKVLYPDKAKLGIKDIPTLIEIGILDKEQFETEIMAYNFKDYISSLTKIQDKEVKGIKWVNLAECEEDEQYVTERLFELFSNTEENIGYKYGDNGSVMIALGSKRKGSFDKNYDEIMKPVKQYINTKECLDKYNEYRFNESTKGIVNPTLGDGELEAVSFRIHEASIDKIDNKKYGITNYFELEEEPEVAGYINFKGNQYPKFKLQKIVGIVLDKDNTHSTVSLLTQFGVVNVKYSKGSYTFYNKTISYVNEDGKKIVLEKSMLEKGTKLFVIGYRRGSNFIAKKYTGCGFNNTTMRITNINVEDGTLTIKEERSRLDD